MSVVAGDGKLDLRAAGNAQRGLRQRCSHCRSAGGAADYDAPDRFTGVERCQDHAGFPQQQLSRVHPILRSCAVLSGRISIGLEEFAVPSFREYCARDGMEGGGQPPGYAPRGVWGLGGYSRSIRVKTQRSDNHQSKQMRVACKGGRLFPDPLDLVIDDEELRISGSVGLDGSLDYIVDVKLSEKMVGSSAYNYLKGRSVRLPVSGTAKSPRINSRALRDEVQRLIAGVATQVTTEKITEELGDKLKGKVKQEDLKKLEDALKNIRL